MSLQTSKNILHPEIGKKKSLQTYKKSKAPPRTHQISNRRMTNIIGAHELSKWDYGRQKNYHTPMNWKMNEFTEEQEM